MSRDVEHRSSPTCGTELRHRERLNILRIHTEVKIKKIRKNNDNNSEIQILAYDIEE